MLIEYALKILQTPGEGIFDECRGGFSSREGFLGRISVDIFRYASIGIRVSFRTFQFHWNSLSYSRRPGAICTGSCAHRSGFSWLRI